MEEESCIGYGILRSFEPDMYGEYGYGFLISQENQVEVEDYFHWWGEMLRRYPKNGAEGCSFHLLYDDLYATGEEVKAALERQIAHRNESRSPFDLGYHVVPWDSARGVFEEMKRQEETHRADPSVDPEFSPFNVLTYRDLGAAIRELHSERYGQLT